MMLILHLKFLNQRIWSSFLPRAIRIRKRKTSFISQKVKQISKNLQFQFDHLQ
jgi:hypothetical protein